MEIKKSETKLGRFMNEHSPVTEENAREVIDCLLPRESEWSTHLPYHHSAILMIGEAYRLRKELENAINFMEKHIKIFSSKYPRRHTEISELYWLLGVSYADLREKNKAIEAIKKWMFYLLIPNNNYDGFEFYSFRTCNKYALDDLKNNTLTVSNPKVFNDPFDCLLLHWYENQIDISQNQHDKEIYEIIEEALSFVKIRCFVRNTPLPTKGEEYPTSRSGIEERYNPLMWAHYADGHKGFCVKYKFQAGMTKTINRDDFERYELSRWGNVEYVETVNINNRMDCGRAFFTKSKVWEYENEVRFLHYDPQWKGDFKPIELPVNSIEEVYFGLHCPKENEEKIREALIGQSVKFYKIEKQPEDFYKLTSQRA